jgi:hypothetical protein
MSKDNHAFYAFRFVFNLCTGVGDPVPQDPYVFGPPGSGFRSTSQRYGSGSQKGVERTEIMLAK